MLNPAAPLWSGSPLLVKQPPSPNCLTPHLGLLLVAITFYSCLTISGPGTWWDKTHIAAVAALGGAVVPYLMLIWWATVNRWYLEEVVRVLSRLLWWEPDWPLSLGQPEVSWPSGWAG